MVETDAYHFLSWALRGFRGPFSSLCGRASYPIRLLSLPPPHFHYACHLLSGIFKKAGSEMAKCQKQVFSIWQVNLARLIIPNMMTRRKWIMLSLYSVATRPQYICFYACLNSAVYTGHSCHTALHEFQFLLWQLVWRVCLGNFVLWWRDFPHLERWQHGFNWENNQYNQIECAFPEENEYDSFLLLLLLLVQLLVQQQV